MSFIVHGYSAPYSGSQLLFVRAIFGLLILSPFVYRELPLLFSGKAKFIWMRAVSGGISAVCFFYTLQNTSTANANLLMGSTPVFVSLFSWWLFKEKVSRREIWGISFVVLGDILLHIPSEGGISFLVGAIGLLGALLASIAFLTLRQAAQTYSPNLIIFSFCFVSALASWLMSFSASALPAFAWQAIHGWSTYGIFAAVALSGLLAQLLMTWAFVFERGPIVTTIGRTSLIWGGLFDALFLQFRPHLIEWICYAVVIIGIILLQNRAATHKTSIQ